MIPLPIKLKEALASLDQRKQDLLSGWLMSQPDLDGSWSLAPDYSCLIKPKEDKDVTTTTESS